MFCRYYEQDLALAKDLQDKLSQAKAYCNLGLAHKALGEYNKAEDCQRYLLSLAQALDNTQVSRCCCLHPVLQPQSVWCRLMTAFIFVYRQFSGPLGTWEMYVCVGAIYLEL